MTNKHFKTISALFVGTMLCAAASMTAFAGETSDNTKKSGQSELAPYRTVISENKDTLGDLLTQNKDTMNDIRELQKELKDAGILTKDDHTALAAQSEDIKAKRQELREIREEISALRDESRAAKASGDIEEAKEKLEEITKLQDKQIEARKELTELLEEKLSSLESAGN